jgi:hypothetical protein
MLSFVKSLWFRPTATTANTPVPVPEGEKRKIIVLPRGRHTLSPLRILEWWGQPKPEQLDPLPEYPESPKPTKP